MTDLQQSVELSLQDLPGVSVLCWDLQSQGHALPGKTLVQRYQGSVNSGLYQVAGKVRLDGPHVEMMTTFRKEKESWEDIGNGYNYIEHDDYMLGGKIADRAAEFHSIST